MKRALVLTAIAFAVAIVAISGSALYAHFTRATGNVDAFTASGMSEVLLAIEYGGFNFVVISAAAILVLGAVVLVHSARM